MPGDHQRGDVLSGLLRNLEPRLVPGEFVFTTVAQVPRDIQWVALISEPEGVTVVVSRDVADSHGFGYDFVASMITLGVKSELDAVGLTARVASALASADISCNVIAGYFHDHLFVPRERSVQALELLRGLAAGS